MTSVVLRATSPCGLCGYRRPMLRFADVKVLAHSLREVGVTLCVGPMPCRGCGLDAGENSIAHPTYSLDAEDQAKVDRVRNRRKKVAT